MRRWKAVAAGLVIVAACAAAMAGYATPGMQMALAAVGTFCGF